MEYIIYTYTTFTTLVNILLQPNVKQNLVGIFEILILIN